MAQPYAGKSSDRLTALINRHNHKKIVHGVDFVFGDLRAVSSPFYNTEVDLVPLNNFYKPQVIRYTRIPLSAFVASGGVISTVDIVYDTFSVYEILEDLAAGTGVDFEERDLVETTHARGGVQTVRIDGSRSLGWMSGEITFQVNNISARLTMSQKVRVAMPNSVVMTNL